MRDHYVVLYAAHRAGQAVSVNDQLAQPHPVRIALGVHADDALRAHRHMVVRVLEPGKVLFVPLRAGPGAPPALLHVVGDDLRDVRPVVAQRDLHDLRLVDLVLVAQAHDPLLDRRAVLRQRDPAHRAQRQPVHALACCVRQLHAVHVDGHCRLRVLSQPFQRPAVQLRRRVDAVVRLDLADHAVQLRVLLQVLPGQRQVVRADRIEPGVHPALVDRLCDRLQVPVRPQLAGHRRRLLRDVQPEGVRAEVIRPPGVLQAVRHCLQRVEQRVTVELVRVRDIVGEAPQRPVALLAQDIANGLQRRAGRRLAVPGDLRRTVGPEQDLILQRVDRVLKVHRRRLRRICLADALHPPHDAAAGVSFVLQPAVHADPGHVRRRQGRGAVPLLQLDAHRLHRHLPCRRQAVSGQQDHQTHLP